MTICPNAARSPNCALRNRSASAFCDDCAPVGGRSISSCAPLRLDMGLDAGRCKKFPTLKQFSPHHSTNIRARRLLQASCPRKNKVSTPETAPKREYVKHEDQTRHSSLTST